MSASESAFSLNPPQLRSLDGEFRDELVRHSIVGLSRATYCSHQADEKKGTATLGSSSGTAPAIPNQASSPAVKEAAGKIVQQILNAGTEASDRWDSLLSDSGASTQIVAEAVLQLHGKKQYSLAVEGLESAIRNDLIEPWIYDVLAFEMKLAGRPSADIARVLESRVDFSATDLQQLLISAALMSRFEAWDEAIVCCREATKLNPDSEDVWLLARSISDKSKNPEHQKWARCGILRHVWGSDHELQHEEATKALTNIAVQLDRDGKSPEAERIRQQLAEAKSVDLRVNLTWIGPADLDLIISEPGGRECSYRNRATPNGGRLIREDGVGDEKAASAKHTERYVCPVAPNGDYQLAVRFVLGKAVGGTAVLDVIENAGTPKEKKTSTTIKLDRKDVVSKLTLTNGRMKQP